MNDNWEDPLAKACWWKACISQLLTGNRILQTQQIKVIVVFLWTVEVSNEARKVQSKQTACCPFEVPVTDRWLVLGGRGLREHGDNNLDCKRGSSNAASHEFPGVINSCCSVLCACVCACVCVCVCV